MGFPRKEYWSGLPFLSPVDHILSELSTMTHLSWVTLHGMAHGFIEVEKAVVHVISLISFSDCGFHSLCPLRDKDKRLMEASWSERLTVGETGLVLMGRVMLRSDQISHSVLSDSWQPHGLQHARPPYPSPTPRSYSNSCPLSRWCHSTISSSFLSFSSCLQPFPASGSLPMSSLHQVVKVLEFQLQHQS